MTILKSNRCSICEIIRETNTFFCLILLYIVFMLNGRISEHWHRAVTCEQQFQCFGLRFSLMYETHILAVTKSPFSHFYNIVGICLQLSVADIELLVIIWCWAVPLCFCGFNLSNNTWTRCADRDYWGSIQSSLKFIVPHRKFEILRIFISGMNVNCTSFWFHNLTLQTVDLLTRALAFSRLADKLPCRSVYAYLYIIQRLNDRIDFNCLEITLQIILLVPKLLNLKDESYALKPVFSSK